MSLCVIITVADCLLRNARKKSPNILNYTWEVFILDEEQLGGNFILFGD